MTTLKESFVLLCSMFLLICSINLLTPHLKTALSEQISPTGKIYTVVVDAGHGGFDSGKVGIDGTLEKDLNLKISKKLEKLLQAADIQVIMTRTDDHSLSNQGTTGQKAQDMKNRAACMNEANADCIVSIHQNSYPDEAIKGAQVFYYHGSDHGKSLAATLQKQLIQKVDPSNHRSEKANDSYYLLKKSTAPIVIVECGFLSNWEESKKLADDTYQQKLAWAIHLGILQYLNTYVN